MLLLACLSFVSLNPPVQVRSHDLANSLSAGNLKRAAELYNTAKSLKHPMNPEDSHDVLTALTYWSQQSERYGHVLVGMRWLKQRGVDVNALKGLPLRYAAMFDHWGKALERLLQYGADPNLQGPFRNRLGQTVFHDTPLVYAIQDEEYHNVPILLKHKADPNILSGPKKKVPLAVAAAKGAVKVCEQLLKAGAKVNLSQPGTKRTALHEAAAANKAVVVRLLLKHKADRKLKDANGLTPIALARAKKARAAIAALGG